MNPKCLTKPSEEQLKVVVQREHSYSKYIEIRRRFHLVEGSELRQRRVETGSSELHHTNTNKEDKLVQNVDLKLDSRRNLVAKQNIGKK